MSWADSAHAGHPWSAGTVPTTLPPGWTDIPGPIPGSEAVVTYLVRTGTGPWAFRSWAGMVPVPTYPGGGIATSPEPAAGVMRVWAWWPDASAIQVVRVTEDGTRTPVRGAYGLTVTGVTRRNACTNPSFEAGLNGYLPINVDTTLSSSTTAPYVAVGTTAMRMVSTTTTTGATMPGLLSGNGPRTIGLNLGLTATATSVTVAVAWVNSTGGSAGSNTLTFTADQIAASVGQSSRVKWNFAAPVTAVSGSVSMTIAGLAAGQSAYLDAVTFERGTTAGDYFDGDTFGGQWSGTAHLSSSILAPVQEIVDGECPLDVPVVYEVYNPALTGGSMAAPAVVLESQNRVWVTHPATPGVPVEVLVTTTPDVTYTLDQAVFPILDSAYPMVVSAALRQAGAAEVEFIVESFAQRDDYIRRLFGDGTPVLKRTPASMGYGDGEWIVVGTLSERASNGSPFDPVRTLAGPYQVVEAPEAVS